jgi:sodium-dependent dicarboxylate transporter 2/3/5
MNADGFSTTRLWLSAIAGGIAVAISLFFIPDPVQAKAVAIASICLALWLTEAVPPFVPTLLLLSLIPIALNGTTYRLSTVMGWMADPVLLLFLGGFSLGVAAQRYGIDAAITGLAVRWSGGQRLRLLALVMISTAMLSMWMSNTAAAAMMIAALRPMLVSTDIADRFRVVLLLGIAIAANLGGMGTPIGSPPNAIAVAALSGEHQVTLLGWMLFGLPLVAVLLAFAFGVLIFMNRIADGKIAQTQPSVAVGIQGLRAWSVVIIFSAMVVAWLSEPLHGLSVSLVAVCGTIVLFGSGLLSRTDLRSIDWSTLILIAGGLGLGRLLQESGAIAAATTAIDWSVIPGGVRIAILIGIGSMMSAVMSNTATATMIIPLAYAIDPSPSTPILVALGTSLGMPFMISTPPNSLVYGEGGIRMQDLFWPGIIIMVVGCLLLSVFGPIIFNLLQ